MEDKSAEVTPQDIQEYNIQDFADIAKLPPGIGFIYDENTGKSGFQYVAEELASIIQEDDVMHFVPSDLKGIEAKHLIGEIIPAVHELPVYKNIMTKLLEKYPNLMWIRGGSMIVENGRFTVDIDAFDKAPGPAGFVGDIRLQYTKKDHDGIRRENPALFMIPVRSLLEAAKERIVNIGSEHGYDVNIMHRGSGFEDWLKDNLMVFKLPGDGSSQEEIEQLLASKAVNR